MIAIGGAMLISSSMVLQSGQASATTGLFVGAPLILCVGGFGIITFGRWLAHGEVAFLTDVAKAILLVNR